MLLDITAIWTGDNIRLQYFGQLNWDFKGGGHSDVRKHIETFKKVICNRNTNSSKMSFFGLWLEINNGLKKPL